MDRSKFESLILTSLFEIQKFKSKNNRPHTPQLPKNITQEV